jgi:hypothetical protein
MTGNRRIPVFPKVVIAFGLLLVACGGTFAQTHIRTAPPARLVSHTQAPGYLHLRALALAYPDRIDEIAFLDNEWALRIGENWFYWANGTMLPEAERLHSNQYTSLRFYNYSVGPLVLRTIDPETAHRLRQRDLEPGPPPARHNGFLNALYGIEVRSDGYQLIVDTRFLGLATQVHRMIVEPLRRVDQEIRLISESDSDVRAFVEELQQVSGFIWRNIAGTASRSYHSYGVAVDLIPHSFQRRFGYWRWAMESGVEDWWDLPLNQRWMVPQPVIDSFERHGFIWGGKWLSFDPIHFEYRPEVLILSRWRDAGVQ